MNNLLNTGKPFLPGKPTSPWKEQTHTVCSKGIARSIYSVRTFTTALLMSEESYESPCYSNTYFINGSDATSLNIIRVITCTRSIN